MSVSFNNLGYLPAGFHDWTISDINTNLVVAFPNSNTREQIYTGYCHLCHDMTLLIAAVEQWVNGSFVTSKPDPNDIDLISIASKEAVDSLTPDQRQKLLALVNGKETQKSHQCDSYFVATVSPDHPQWPNIKKVLDYWEKW